MPRAEDILDALGGAAYISTLDMSKGHWQVPVEKSSRHKTAFVTPMGKFEFTTVSFGFVRAPAVF